MVVIRLRNQVSIKIFNDLICEIHNHELSSHFFKVSNSQGDGFGEVGFCCGDAGVCGGGYEKIAYACS